MEKKLTAGLIALTVPEEIAEVMAVLNGKGDAMPKLKKEKPQKDYKLVNDVPTHVGWLEMWTIAEDWKDAQGRNRKGSTFGLLGLQELGIDPTKCEVVNA